MTNKEVLIDLKSKNKPYNQIEPKMQQSQFSLMCIKIENDLCKPITVIKFFGRFGYVGDWNNFERK